MRINISFFSLSLMLCLVNVSLQMTEICASMDSSYVYQPATALKLNTPVHFTQADCSQYFNIDKSVTSTPGYLLLKVEFEDFSSVANLQPLVAFSYTELPSLYFDDQGMTNDFEDLAYNAFIKKQTKHHLLISVSNKKGVTLNSINFVVYKYFYKASNYVSDALKYTVTLTHLSQYPCQVDSPSCQNNYFCDTTLPNPTCSCLSGADSIDCKASVKQVYLGTSASSSVTDWIYYAYYINSASQDIQVKVAKSGGSVDIMASYCSAKMCYLPDFTSFDNIIPLATEDSQWTITLEKSTLKKALGQVVYLTIFNDGAKPTKVDLSIKSNGNVEANSPNGDDDGNISENRNKNSSINVIIFSLMGTGIALFTIITVFFLFKYKALLRARRAQAARNAQQNDNDTFLLKADLDKYFPAKKFSDFKSSFAQSTCSICLEDFQPKKACHQLYCEHIFHDKCIETWLSSKKKCPNCNKEMTHTAIQQFLASSSAKGQNLDVKTPQKENVRPVNPQNSENTDSPTNTLNSYPVSPAIQSEDQLLNVRESTVDVVPQQEQNRRIREAVDQREISIQMNIERAAQSPVNVNTNVNTNANANPNL